MDNMKSHDGPASSRRFLLAMASRAAGLATIGAWTKPVVQSVLSPAHAQTTNPPEIFGLRITGDPQCSEGEPDTVVFQFFNIEYNFSSLYGIVSHVITGDCGDDTLEILDGNRQPGDNLIGAEETGSYTTTGDEFSGSVSAQLCSISGPSPLSCQITVTLTDANGGQVSDSILVAPGCVP